MAISSFWKQFESGYFVLSQPTGKVLLLGRHLTSTGIFDKLAILGQPILIGYWQIITYFIVVQIHEISWKIIFLSPIQSYTFTIKHGCNRYNLCNLVYDRRRRRNDWSRMIFSGCTVILTSSANKQLFAHWVFRVNAINGYLSVLLFMFILGI